MTEQSQYLEACGGSYRRAIHGVMSLSRAVWAICAESTQELQGRSAVERTIPRVALEHAFHALVEKPSLEYAFDPLIELLCKTKSCKLRSDDRDLVFQPFVVNPLEVGRSVLEGLRPDHELRYFMMQNVRLVLPVRADLESCTRSARAGQWDQLTH